MSIPHADQKAKPVDQETQLYRCFDDKHTGEQELSTFYQVTDLLPKKIASFITCLNSSQHKGLKFKDRL